MTNAATYRGRLAPTPSGALHLGHARTFWIAQQRAQQHAGALVLRVEDLDPQRCRPEFAAAMLEDLRWFGFEWQEGPDLGGPFEPYVQSQRREFYETVWRRLVERGVVYPSPHSRRDIAGALLAPHEPLELDAGDEAPEPLFPPALRPAKIDDAVRALGRDEAPRVNWRFRVPDGRAIAFVDGRQGAVVRTAGVDFGDFLVWRKDGYPSYELAVVCDDHAMQITEVVRGADLLTSTARQLLLYEALEWQPPAFYHCPLMLDEAGRRLAKRTEAVSLAALRASGRTPQALRESWGEI